MQTGAFTTVLLGSKTGLHNGEISELPFKSPLHSVHFALGDN